MTSWWVHVHWSPIKVLKETRIQIYERGADVGGTWRVSLSNPRLRVYSR